MTVDTVFFVLALLAVCFPLHFVRKALQQRAAGGDDGDRAAAARRRQRRRRARGGNADLFAPLLANSAEHHQHRLDAALRDADEGYNRCETCDFANFKRLTRCSLCGDRVAPHADRLTRATSAGSSRSSLRSTAVGSASSRRSSKSVSFALAPAEPSTAPAAPESPELRAVVEYTDRQLQAIKRKEWTRKLDVKGGVFWYRDSRDDVADPRFPGFVAHFEPRRRRSPAAWSADDVDIDSLSSTPTATSSVSASSSAGEPEPPALWLSSPHYPRLSSQLRAKAAAGDAALTLEQRALELEGDALPVEIRLTDATVVDAARFPLLCDRANPALTWKEVLRIASRSFPTKYAHFATATAALSASARKHATELRVRRSALLEDSLAALSALPAAAVRAPLRIRFVDDDASSSSSSAVFGSQREWFARVDEQLFDPRSGVFRRVGDAAVYVNADSRHAAGAHHLALAFAAGRFLGRALLDGHALGCRLALPLRKLLLGAPLAFPDLARVDPALFRSLSQLVARDNVEALGLTFSVAEQRAGALVAVDLVRNGRGIAVTDDNKDFYLERRFLHELFERGARQLFALLKGFFEVLPQELLMLFDPAELDLLLGGPADVDADDWEAHAQHSAELLRHPARGWFWALVRELSDAQRRRLLRFATGSDRVPVAGFAALAGADGRACAFALHACDAGGDDGGRLRAHEAANRLDVPLVASIEHLRAALLVVVGDATDDVCDV